jgi:hypothetical protein
MLKGAPELRARLKALKTVFKPIGREWAEETRDLAKRAVPVRSGRLQRSFRVKNASQRKATVVGHYSAYFIDAGTRAHDERPRRAKAMRFATKGGHIMFAKKVHHPATKARPFRRASADEALRRRPILQYVIDAWNKAA